MNFDTTWPAIQVGLGRVKASLGGHDDGVWDVDDGVENTSLPLWKRGRMAWSDCATLSCFTRVANEVVSEK